MDNFLTNKLYLPANNDLYYTGQLGNTVTSSTTLSGLGITSADFNIKISTLDVNFNPGTTTTISGLVDLINNDAALKDKVKASFDETKGTFSLISLTGENITWTDNGSSNLGAKLSLSSEPEFATYVSNSQIKVNGIIAAASTKLSDLGLTSDIGFNIKIGATNVTLNAEDKITSGTTISQLVDIINNDSTLKNKVKASYDATSGTFSLTSLTGEQIKWTDNSGNLKSKLNLAGVNSEFGSDAKIYLNGMTTNPITEATNSFTINGLTYNIKAVTSADITINTSTDVDAVFNNIKKFMDDYNNTIDILYKKVNETYSRDYQPLTDPQKEEMSADDIKAWETKAKTGLLHNDSILSQALQNLRYYMTDPVNGLGDSSQLTAIGIVTGSYTDNAHGKLKFSDETGDALKQAIRDNPDGIIKLFTTSTSDSTDLASQGIAQRLYSVMSSGIKNLNTVAGFSTDTDDDSTLGKQITDLSDRIDDEKDRLSDLENSYYSKFTAMEQAIQQMDSQSSWLSQQLGG